MGMSKHMMNKQKKWSKPQLIIIGRGKPEENVLAACKGFVGALTPVHGYGPCHHTQCLTNAPS